MLEKHLEEYLVENHHVLEKDLKFVGRQQSVGGKRIDMLFESKIGEVVLVEVKQVAKRRDIAQLFDYAGYFLELSKKSLTL